VAYDGYSVIPRPVYGQGLVYICTGYESPKLLAIQVDGQGDVTGTHVQWSIDKAVPHTPSLLLVGDELYMVSDRGIASCVDALSGTLHWRERIGGNFSASPIEAAGLIYLLDEEGTTTVIRANKQFQVVATNSVPQRTLASYAVAEDTIYLRGDSHLYCIRGR
jgi:outer membrane protein assembly factor BamB